MDTIEMKDQNSIAVHKRKKELKLINPDLGGSPLCSCWGVEQSELLLWSWSCQMGGCRVHTISQQPTPAWSKVPVAVQAKIPRQFRLCSAHKIAQAFLHVQSYSFGLLVSSGSQGVFFFLIMMAFLKYTSVWEDSWSFLGKETTKIWQLHVICCLNEPHFQQGPTIQ